MNTDIVPWIAAILEIVLQRGRSYWSPRSGGTNQTPEAATLRAPGSPRRPPDVPLKLLYAMQALHDHRAWPAVKAIVDRHYASMAKTYNATLRSKVKRSSLKKPSCTATPAASINIHGGVFGGGEACAGVDLINPYLSPPSDVRERSKCF